MAIFTLKVRDTRPILEVALKSPDGSAHDLTGSTAWKLHVKLTDGSVITRDMVIFGAATDGVLRYTWVAGDWGAGGLPLNTAPRDYQMEYEVIAGTARLTFPNDGYDTLHVVSDLGQG